MVKAYSDDELEAFATFYEEHGAVRLPGLIDQKMVETILGAIQEARELFGTDRPAGAPPYFYSDDGKMSINRLWKSSPAVRDFLLQPDLARPIARIARSKALRFWFDLTFIHEMGREGDAGVGTPWHHDIAAFGFKGEQLPSLWMALTPTDADRSRLMFIDKSHKTAPYFRPPLSMDEPPADGHLEVPDIEKMIADGEIDVLTWDCEPGDAIVIHPFTLHGAYGNRGSQVQGSRIAITTRWLGDDIRWIPTVYGGHRPRPEEASIPIGGRPTGPEFPIVWPPGADEPTLRHGGW